MNCGVSRNRWTFVHSGKLGILRQFDSPVRFAGTIAVGGASNVACQKVPVVTDFLSPSTVACRMPQLQP
ncbi:hypothetical protein CGZ80_06460 [Rhodopirellula sp. MGV]|nr:hypothetical protein CGZ80_06460 [Rhodopirellula sp. MGV]PNY36244.1 hypothetical protein C2E31_14125 [Rhodopirellula baltica]